MNILKIVLLNSTISVLAALGLAQEIKAGTENLLQTELNFIKAAVDAAKGGDYVASDRSISGPSQLETALSITIVRRAAAVAGWLQNDNRYGAAKEIARLAIERTRASVEKIESERIERLYWEAWLEGVVLDHKARSVELLSAARKLAPKDGRIVELHERLSAALQEFGS